MVGLRHHHPRLTYIQFRESATSNTVNYFLFSHNSPIILHVKIHICKTSLILRIHNRSCRLFLPHDPLIHFCNIPSDSHVLFLWKFSFFLGVYLYYFYSINLSRLYFMIPQLLIFIVIFLTFLTSVSSTLPSFQKCTSFILP